MDIATLLAPDRVKIDDKVSSKKRALEQLSELLARGAGTTSESEIFDALNHRERLGSTGLGSGVAIPHGRMAGIDDAIGAVMKLSQGVDYDAPDNQPVDLMFALIVPEESTDVHLELLSGLAEMFADERQTAKLRTATQTDAILNIFRQSIPSYTA